MTRASLPRRPFLAAAIVLAAIACRTDLAAPDLSRLAPPAASAARADKGRAGDWRPTPVRCLARGPASATARIGRNGGVLSFGGSRLVIPPGALDRGVRITAVTRDDGSGAVDFAPEGLRFHRPASLVLSAMGCATPTAGEPAVVYLGARDEVLETIAATYDRKWKEVAAPITHFSGYAIAF